VFGFREKKKKKKGKKRKKKKKKREKYYEFYVISGYIIFLYKEKPDIGRDGLFIFGGFRFE
jgi:hypothetical protein